MTAPAFPGTDLGQYLNFLLASTPITGTAGSDDVQRAFMAANAQRYAANVAATAQLAGQNQANQLRFYDLMGTAPGENGGLVQTDASRKWQAELQGQLDIQNQRARQEMANIMGFAIDANGQLTQNPTLAKRQLDQAKEEAQRDREQAAAMERLQQQGRETLQTGQQGWQTAERVGTQQFQATESKYERDLREKLQKGQLDQQESEFARNYLIKQGELRGYVVDANGNPTGQLTEAGRAAREGERTQRAALAAQLMQAPKDVFRAGAYFRSMGGQGTSPYTMGLGGGGIAGFTSLAQRAGGTPGSATLADVEAMPGMAPAAGLPAAGLNPQALQALAAPGAQTQMAAATGTPEPLAAQNGVSAAQLLGTQAPAANANFTQDIWRGQSPEAAAAREAAMSSGAYGGSVNDLNLDENTLNAAVMNPDPNAAAKKQAMGPESLGSMTGTTADEEEIPGLTPGGPVGDPLSSLIRNGRAGMGAGGNFQGREPPDGAVPGVIPYVDPQVLVEPEVRALVRDVRRQGVEDDRRGRRKRGTRKSTPSGPAGPQDAPLTYDARQADRRRWSDERFLQGLAGLNRRGVLGAPGTGPAGPVDAPLWPEGGGGAAMPEVSTPSSVGASSFAMSPLAAPAAAPAAAPGLGGMNAGNQDAALNYLSNFLVQGVGNQDPQFLQKMSSTQRGTLEGGLQALGLSLEDFNEAVAQTRFNNVGNVLSA